MVHRNVAITRSDQIYNPGNPVVQKVGRYITPTRSLECLAESAWAMTWISCQIEIHDPHHCRKVPVD